MLANLLRLLWLALAVLGAAAGMAAHLLLGAAPAWAAVLALALPLLGTPVSITWSTVRARRASGNPAGGNGPWWRAWWGEVRASTRVFLLRMPWRQRSPAVLPALGFAAGPPVLLVHGYLCNHRVWDDLAPVLREAGHPVLGVDLEPLFTSIDNYAPLVEQAVQRLCRETGAPRVLLLGHSMGGLAIRAWLRVHGAQRMAGVVTLGTPHWGTRIPQHVHTPNGRQMAWNSDWVQQLASGETPQLRARMAIAITPQDNIVFPQRAQVLEGAQVHEFEGRGHLQLCRDGEVADWVVQRLAELGTVG